MQRSRKLLKNFYGQLAKNAKLEPIVSGDTTSSPAKRVEAEFKKILGHTPKKLKRKDNGKLQSPGGTDYVKMYSMRLHKDGVLKVEIVQDEKSTLPSRKKKRKPRTRTPALEILKSSHLQIKEKIVSRNALNEAKGKKKIFTQKGSPTIAAGREGFSGTHHRSHVDPVGENTPAISDAGEELCTVLAPAENNLGKLACAEEPIRAVARQLGSVYVESDIRLHENDKGAIPVAKSETLTVERLDRKALVSITIETTNRRFGLSSNQFTRAVTKEMARPASKAGKPAGKENVSPRVKKLT